MTLNLLSKHLRNNSTATERLLWGRLNRKQLAGLKFRRQCPVGSYIVDFVCFEKMLIIEVDGGQHAEHIKQDIARDEWLTQNGYRVLRFWNNQVLQETDVVLGMIYNCLTHPHPNPPP